MIPENQAVQQRIEAVADYHSVRYVCGIRKEDAEVQWLCRLALVQMRLIEIDEMHNPDWYNATWKELEAIMKEE